MRGSKLRVTIAAVGLLAGLVGMAGPPAAADPTTIKIAGLPVNGVTPIHDTHIPTDCARTGTGPGPTYPHWSNVPHGYSVEADDPGATECFEAIAAFLRTMALDESSFSATAPQQLRSALFSGTVNLARPYEVFLDNIYISTVALSTLSTTEGSASGLGSCVDEEEYLIISCQDDELSTILVRDDWGNPVKDWAGRYVYLNLTGLLSQGGGTTYGNIFVLNTDVYPYQPFDDRVQHHEQVHSQQWSLWNWDFGRRYLEDLFNSQGNANYNHMLYGPIDGVLPPAPCYQQYERAAGFQDGNYAFRDPAHGGPADALSAGTNDRFVANGDWYPDGWTTQINNGWNDTQSARWHKCPSKWQDS